MALESGTYINSLVATNPVATDGLAQADDHMRLIKATVLASFPNITGAMTATHTVLNGIDARVTALETAFATGTKMLFQQTTAPTGWTKDTSSNDKALRVVSGTVGSGGSAGFSSAFSSITPAGSISNTVAGSTASHAISVNEMPAHSHSITGTYKRDDGSGGGGHFPHGSARSTSTSISGFLDITASDTGGGAGHTHGVGTLAVSSTFSGTSIDLAVAYVDVIIATRD